MKPIDLVAVTVLCFLSSTAVGQSREDKCAPDVYETISRNMLQMSESSPSHDGSNVISAACRTWPYKTGLLLAALAYDERVEYEKELLVAVIDKKAKRVINRYWKVIGEDAVTEVGEYSLKLDTARYQLTTDVRAFGVTFDSSARGASCGEAYWGHELTLFVPERKTLRPVLSLNLYQQRWFEGCPAATSQALWEDAVLTLSMADTSTNGFYDIVVTAKITVNADGVPTENHRDRIEQHTLHYDGKSYQKGKRTPWWLRI